MLGLCSVTFREKTPEEIISLVKEAGLDCVEWESQNHVPYNNLKNAEKVRKLTDDAGLKISSYGSYYIVGSQEEFEPYIHTAKVLGTKMIRVWAGNRGSNESSKEWFNKVVEATHQIADMANKKGISISFEYHSGSLTDTPESTYQLMKAIKADNVFLYWQPAEILSVKERMDSLKILGKWISNVHVFHWKDYDHRFSLEKGKDEWLNYISMIKKESPNKIHFLLEFVKEDDPNQLFEDAQTLQDIRKLVKQEKQ